MYLLKTNKPEKGGYTEDESKGDLVLKVQLREENSKHNKQK